MKGKKGMYFTVMTVAFLLVFLFVYILPGQIRLSDKMIVTEMRVDSMNDFIKSFQRDIERGLYISSYRALLALEEYIIINGKFLNDTETVFTETVLNGTVYGVDSSLMLASTFPEWMTRIQSESSKFNIETNITLNGISVYQTDPWNVKIRASTSVIIRDTSGIALWSIDEGTEATISILEFEDPLFIVNTFGRTTNIIEQTPYDGNYFFVNGSLNISNLIEHIENSYYAANTDAPNFLMRFENDISPSPQGIECMVNLKKLGDYGLDVDEDASIIDHKYWQGGSDGDYRINMTPSWMRIDAGHRDRYNLSGVSYID